MRIGKLNAILKAAHKNEVAERGIHGQQLEEQLIQDYRRQHGREWFFMLKPQTAMARLTLGAVVLAALGFGACSMPTETEVPMGKQVSIGFKSEEGHEYAYDYSFDFSKETLHSLKKIPGVEDVSISDSIEDGGRHMEVLLWGDDVTGESVLQLLHEEGGLPENSFVEIKDLSGTVRENWASKIGREFFHVELDHNLSDEEMKAQILAQMSAEGFEPTDVSVFTGENGQRNIFISGSQDSPDGEGVHEIEDEMVIEWVTEGAPAGDGETEDL
jgi:hypothetical protein